MKSFAIILLAFMLLVGAGAALYVRDARDSLERPMAIGPEPITVTVLPGATLPEVAESLHRQGVLAKPLALVWFARLEGLSSRIKAGEYQVASATTPRELLELLVAGKVIQYAFTIIEGWTFRQLREAITANDTLVDTLDGVDDQSVMDLLGHEGVHPEGWFYPDTYHFPAGTTDVDFLRRALGTMHSRLQEAWPERAEELPFDQPYDALILASIVEKETGAAIERTDIAGVFVRRLQRGMRLEADPTVIYGLGADFDGNLTRKDLETDTPYNTYVRRGLPPTPIAIPSWEAVEAALNPADGKTLFFVARGDGTGTHHFSVTYAEHQEAVAQYLRKLRKLRKKKASGSGG